MEIIHPHKLESVKQVIDFMFAGNATFTLRNSKSGNRFTYKVSTPRKQSNPNKPIYFVNVMVGSDNETSYSFLGTLFGKYAYQHSRKSNLLSTHKTVDVFQRFLNFIENNTTPNGIEIWHEGKCGCCGRKLTVPASVYSGIGPNCAVKRWKAADARLKLTLSK